MFNLWTRLQSVTHYVYESNPGSTSKMGWNGTGQGTVTVSHESSFDELFFKELGHFTLEQNGHRMDTQNEFIWRRLSDTRIKLLHSRWGRDHPVELFDLLYEEVTDQWLSESAHRCGDDLYSGKASWINGRIHFTWTISGPRKEENLHYNYTRSL